MSNLKIELTNLKPETTRKDIRELCKTAVENNYYAVCVNPYYVRYVRELIRREGYNLKVVTVIGYPLGMCTDDIKRREAEKAVIDGADEIDVVMNIGAFREKNYKYVQNEISSIVSVTKMGWNHKRLALVKVIIETGLLNEFEIIQATRLVKQTGADFIKTCTSSLYETVKLEDVYTIHHTEPDLPIKISGGILNKMQLERFSKIGSVQRVGTSSVLW